MRIGLMLGAGLALTTAGAAWAQGPGAPYPAPGPRPMPSMQRPPMPPAPRVPVGAQRPSLRWGSQVGGRWWGGANAPGGWAAYRQPHQGYRVPRYWVAPRFYVNDWARYGLYQPSGGYNWVRYYDDAILIDGQGGVQDWRGGLDWDGYDRADSGYAYADDDRGPPPPHHDGHRMAGGRDGGPGYPPPPGAPGTWVSPDGRTTVTTTTSGGYAGVAPVIVQPGYGYAAGYGGAVTTVTVQSAPVVTTTTTTEIVEDRVTYTRPVVRRAVRARVWRPRPTCTCRPVRRHRAPAVLGS